MVTIRRGSEAIEADIPLTDDVALVEGVSVVEAATPVVAPVIPYPLAREQGLRSVEITTDPDNIPSQKVITTNGGVLVAQFNKGEAYGHKDGLRFRIDLG